MASPVASLWLLSGLALALIGCSSSSKEPPENPNVFPADYKNEILNTMTTTLDDPTNIRGAYISDPVLRRAGSDERYNGCVRSESRDPSKQYTGSKERIGFFYCGHLQPVVDAAQEKSGYTAPRPIPKTEKILHAQEIAL